MFIPIIKYITICCFALFQWNCGEPKQEPQEHQEIHADWPSLLDSPWPMVRHDPQGTNRSKFSGPRLGEILWVAGDSIRDQVFVSSLVLDNEGYLYGATHQHYQPAVDDGDGGSILLKFSPDGEIIDKLRLEYLADSYAETPLITTEGQIILSAGSEGVISVNSDLDTNWINDESLVDNGYFFTAPIINLNGNTYFNYSGQVYVIDQNGNTILTADPSVVNYTTNLSGTFSFPGDKIFLIYYDGFYCLDLAGNTLWTYPATNVHSCMVNNNNDVFFYGSGHQFISLDEFGNVNWQTPVEDLGLTSGNSSFYGAIGINGDIYFHGYDSLRQAHLLSFNAKTGELNWDVQTYYYSDIVTDKDGYIYIVTFRETSHWQSDPVHKVQCYTQDGELDWEVDLPISFGRIGGLILGDGILYIPVDDNYDVAVIAVQ